MGKGDAAARQANLRATRAQINNANASAQTRAFKARQLAKQKREAEERKLRAKIAAEKKAKEAKAAAAPSEGEEQDPNASEE